MARRRYTLAFSFAVFTSIQSAVSQNYLPGTFPHLYPGQPAGDFSPKWQGYFQVKEKLPGVTFELPRAFSGNIPVQRNGHPNNTLFFLGFEHKNGSLTAPADPLNKEPWGIWLNGGPGSSSMYGAFFENGPIRLDDDGRASPNNHSWDKLADYFWIDQPVGVGYATADSSGYVADEDQVGSDFGTLSKSFRAWPPAPLHLTGESYAGVYIPYIMKAYFGMQNPPVTIAKMAIGDPSITYPQVYRMLPSLSVIETYPQLIGYDPEVYNYFKEQTKLCGYDIKMSYPQQAPLPSVPLTPPSSRYRSALQSTLSSHTFLAEVKRRHLEQYQTLTKRDRELNQREWKRDLSQRVNGTVDPWYGCMLLDMYIDYALNYTYPWNLYQTTGDYTFNVYDIPDATSPGSVGDASMFLNDEPIKTALHAPTSKDWNLHFSYTFGRYDIDPSPRPAVFLDELAANATARGVGIVLYCGNNDALIAHRGTEIVIQNTTFGGIRGFTVKPSTPWFDDSGKFAGIIRQERNWTYALFQNAGHMVPTTKPISAFTFLREFILGHNTTGLVTSSGDVIGGINSTLADDVLPGSDEIFYGSRARPSKYVAPDATRAAWKTFIQTGATPATDEWGSKTDVQHVGLGLYGNYLPVSLGIIGL